MGRHIKKRSLHLYEVRAFKRAATAKLQGKALLLEIVMVKSRTADDHDGQWQIGSLSNQARLPFVAKHLQQPLELEFIPAHLAQGSSQEAPFLTLQVVALLLRQGRHRAFDHAPTLL